MSKYIEDMNKVKGKMFPHTNIPLYLVTTFLSIFLLTINSASIIKTANGDGLFMEELSANFVDHNVEETIEKTLGLGMWAGLSVYPVTKLTPERAMNIVRKYGTEHIMIHSAADWGISDPLNVPLVAREMRKAGFNEKEIERVTFYNAYDFYKQSPKFTWRP
jgi:predicted metal-dependent TIM-barrel fold hydrolase